MPLVDSPRHNFGLRRTPQRGATIAYDAQKQELDVNGVRVPAPFRGKRQRLTVYGDRTTLEVFTSDGLVGVPVPFLPKVDDLGLGVRVRRGEVKFQSLDVHELKPAWRAP